MAKRSNNRKAKTNTSSRPTAPETELDAEDHWERRAEARYDVFEYIEVFYNRQRRHSYLGYVSPVRFEAEAAEKTNSISRGDAA